jgi:hypothetical protein
MPKFRKPATRYRFNQQKREQPKKKEEKKPKEK